MAVSAKAYGNLILHALNKRIDLTNDTIKVMLLTNAHVPDQDAHLWVSSVRANEVAAGGGYAAGGATLGSKTLTYTAASNTVTFDAADTSWTITAGTTVTARYAVIYDDTPATDATKPLIAYVDFGQDEIAGGSGGGTFSIVWNASGIVTVTAS